MNVMLFGSNSQYFPEKAESWSRCKPSTLGVDELKLHSAIQFAHDNETPWCYDLNQEKAISKNDRPPWNEIMGPLKPRGGPAGLVIYEGHIVAEWGNIERVDATFSATKSYIGLCAVLAFREGLINDFDVPVRDYKLCDSFESPQNKSITWRHLLQQTSEWEGVLWGKPDTVDHNRRIGIDIDDSQRGEKRRLRNPGCFWEYNDVRVNLASYCLTLLFEQALPDVLHKYIMDPIGATNSWEWYGYRNSFIEVNGRSIPSVSGGAHWGGGLWISSLDHARMGLLMARGGLWGESEIFSATCLEPVFQPCRLNNNYGFFWWLNNDHGIVAGAPETSVFAYGAGGNYVWVDSTIDLVVVVRWLNEAAMDNFSSHIVSSLPGADNNPQL